MTDKDPRGLPNGWAVFLTLVEQRVTCPCCSRLLEVPAGASVFRCSCGTVLKAPEKRIECVGCRTVLQVPDGGQVVKCSICNMMMRVPSSGDKFVFKYEGISTGIDPRGLPCGYSAMMQSDGSLKFRCEFMGNAIIDQDPRTSPGVLPSLL